MLRMLLHALKFDRQICRCVVMMHDGIRVWVVAERDGGRMTLQSVYKARQTKMLDTEKHVAEVQMRACMPSTGHQPNS